MLVKELIPRYLSHLRILGRSGETLRTMPYHLHLFANLLEESGIRELEQMNPEAMGHYQEELAWHRTKKNQLLKKSTQALNLIIAKGFCKWLVEEDYLAADPAKGIRQPKQPKRLPRNILEVREAKNLITKPDTQNLAGYRDRLLLELLYSTGIRRAECANIRVEDVDYTEGYLRINSGKGDKDRVVPLGKIACGLCESYVKGIRPDLLKGKDDGYLILNRWGQKMHPMGVYQIVRKYARLSRKNKNATPHTFRRSCTTHMLKKGANIRHLQEMLGHANINSTQVYLKLTINDLKKSHAKYHPREREKE